MNPYPIGAPSAPPRGSGDNFIQRLASVIDVARASGSKGVTIGDLQRIYSVHRSCAGDWIVALVKWGHLAPAGKRPSSGGRPSTFYILAPKPSPDRGRPAREGSTP